MTDLPCGLQMWLIPTSIKAANKLVAFWHRHHKPVQGAMFAVSVGCDLHIHGAAIVGRPQARMLQDGWTCEVTRCVTDGTPNACSLLYGAVRRAVRALGYLRCVTYTLQSESGASLRGANWINKGEAGGGSWSRPSRGRTDKHPLEVKIRWEAW